MSIEMNIAHYRAILKLHLDDRKRAVVARLLAEAQENLVLANKQAARSNAKRDPVSKQFPSEQTAEKIGRRLLDVIVYVKSGRVGEKLSLGDLIETSEIGDWKMPDFKLARTYAGSHGWLVVQADTLTLTTAGLAAARVFGGWFPIAEGPAAFVRDDIFDRSNGRV
jgi:hypothetical protein